MPTPRFDAVIAALTESWFFPESVARSTAAAQGAAYAKTLRDEFNSRPDQAAIESSLGLGAYLVHTQANQRKRVALRAVLAAAILMKKRPTTQVANLRRQYESLPLDALKRAFVNMFPLMQADAMRPWWAPYYFTDPILLPDLRIKQDWRNKQVPKYMFIVHMNNDVTKSLWDDPVAELAKYSGSSMTLMSNEKPYVYNSSGMVQGVILSVPPNNILVTYHADLMTALHSGSVHAPTEGLSQTFGEEILELAAATASSSGGLDNPISLLRKTGPNSQTPTVGKTFGSHYNEIVVCGKPGAPLPWGTTEKLKLVGLFMLITKDGKLLQAFDAEARLKAMEAHEKKLKRPLLFLPSVP